MGLLIGFAVGLSVGSYVVAFIQRPLSRALSHYYQKESIDRVESELERLKQSGQALPFTPKQVEDRVLKENLLDEEVYIDPAEMMQQLKIAYPEQFKGVQLPPPNATARRREGRKADPLVSLAPRRRRPAGANQEFQRPRAVFGLRQGIAAGGDAAVQPLALLPNLALRGGRTLSARTALRPHVSAV